MGSTSPYEITSSPNDFNLATLYDFIKVGVLKIPGFQRHYVWDQRRASKLIESLLLGLPIPQIFLYEAGRNSFLVIDGQQRLMSIYYFREGRFPIMESRPALRRIFDLHGSIPDDVLADDRYFAPFSLKLKPRPSGPNPFHGLTYDTLGDRKVGFDIKTIRNVVIRQLQPRNDMSSVYEIFTRLNSEGVNLERQELRASLYHSVFYEMLGRANELPGWRRLLGAPEADLRMGDIQYLLRAFALLCMDYSPSMVSFLDRFSEHAKTLGADRVEYLLRLFESFLTACSHLPADVFFGGGSAFSIMLFEAIFRALCEQPLRDEGMVVGRLDAASVQALRVDPGFVAASSRGTTSSANVLARLQAARAHVRLI